MGWTSTYVGYGRDRKDLLKNEIYGKYQDCLEYVEVKGSNIWVIGHNKDGEKYGELYLTSYKDGEFAWKDIGISAHPFYYNCSKKFYEMAKEIYSDKDYQYAKEWLEKWEEVNNKEKARKELIKSLKVGDTIEFITANYGNQKQWRVSSITPKILFEGYNLQGWKTKEFKIV